jgi:hypothetical protein
VGWALGILGGVRIVEKRPDGSLLIELPDA